MIFTCGFCLPCVWFVSGHATGHAGLCAQHPGPHSAGSSCSYQDTTFVRPKHQLPLIQADEQMEQPGNQQSVAFSGEPPRLYYR